MVCRCLLQQNNERQNLVQELMQRIVYLSCEHNHPLCSALIFSMERSSAGPRGVART